MRSDPKPGDLVFLQAMRRWFFVTHVVDNDVGMNHDHIVDLRSIDMGRTFVTSLSREQRDHTWMLLARDEQESARFEALSSVCVLGANLIDDAI